MEEKPFYRANQRAKLDVGEKRPPPSSRKKDEKI